MASGTFSNTSSAWQVKIEYTTTNDAANNRTYVEVKLYGQRTDQNSGSNGACFQPSITIDGTSSGGSYYTTEYKNTWSLRHTYGKYVTHGADGSKSITISGSIYKAPGSPATTQDGKTKTASGTITLTTYETKKTLTLSKGTGISTTSGGGSYKEGTSVSINAIVLAGYKWNKWSGSTTYLTKDATTQSNSVKMPASNITLTANATPLTYTVNWDGNGGTSSVASNTVTFNSTYTLPTATRSGHTFKGWYTAASGGTQITASTKHTTAGDVTYYAQWTPWTFTVKYKKNTGEGSMSDSSHTHATASTLTVCTFEKPGYSFLGWNTAADGSGNQYADNDDALVMAIKESITNGGSITLYAQWGIKGIKFYHDGEWIIGRVKIFTNGTWY